MEKEYVRLNREYDSHKWITDPNTIAVLIRCLLNANTNDTFFEGHLISKGSFATSVSLLSKQTGVKQNAIRTALKRLTTDKVITIQPTNRFTIITVCEYGYYNDLPQTKVETTNKQLTNNPIFNLQTTDEQPTIQLITEDDKEQGILKKKEDANVVSNKKEKSFVKPTIEEILDYCHQRGNHIDAEKFWNYYESIGWKVGKNPMKDWRAAVRTWERKETDVNRESSQLSLGWGEKINVEHKDNYWQE
jgi:hypothetical protein